MAELPAALVRAPRLAQWIAIGPDGDVTVHSGKVEIGQGIATALAQVVADELGIDVSLVRVQPASTTRSPDEGYTAGSMSIEQSAVALRYVCAQIRATAAARSIPYTAVDLDVDISADTVPREPADRRLIGTSVARLDLPAKFAGAPAYVHDLTFPLMGHGRVVRGGPGARLERVDESLVAGQARVVRHGDFLGVIADHEHAAEAAAARLAAACVWSPGHTLPDHRDLGGWLRRGPHRTRVQDERGEAPSGSTATLMRASYSRPFIAHASLTPSCAVARWSGGTVEVWTHSQGIYPLRAAIADVCGLPVGAVTVHHAEGSGCYGHNGADDAAVDAVLLARAEPGRAVRLQWSRADEHALAPFGSAMAVDVEAALDAQGRIEWWASDAWSNSHVMRPGFAGAGGLLAARELTPDRAPPDTDDPGGIARNSIPLYSLPARRIRTHTKLDMPVRTSSLRSLGAFANVFAIESFMDELAAAAGADPLEFRLRHLHDERARTVLIEAAERGGFGGPTSADHGRGLAVARYKNTGGWCAVVAEVAAGSSLQVRSLTVAVDVGMIVNPDGLANQIEGGAIQATSWTIREGVTFGGGRVTSTDWEGYPILRFSEVPAVHVHALDRPACEPLGAGEIVHGPVAAAIANALFDATGLRARDLPLTDARLRALAS